MWKVVYLLIPLVFFLGGCKTLDLSGNSSIEDAYRQGVRDGLMQKEQRIERELYKLLESRSHKNR
ncbi:MAG: hypothetical protein QXL24_02055 [Candidatus Jordarchaeaceae archaeon]